MKIQVKPIGYKFRVTNNEGVFDIESTTELSMAKSEEIIRKFFENFVIRKSDIRVSSEEIGMIARPAAKNIPAVKNKAKSAVENGANSTMKNIMRSNKRMIRPVGVRSEEKPLRKTAESNIAREKNARNIEKNAAKIKEKIAAKIKEKKPIRTAEKKPVRSNTRLAENKRETVKSKWRKLGGSLNDEFTLQEYIKSLRDAGYEYTKTSWEAVPSQQISRLIELGEIEKIDAKKPYKFRKIKVSTSARSEKSRELLKA